MAPIVHVPQYIGSASEWLMGEANASNGFWEEDHQQHQQQHMESHFQRNYMGMMGGLDSPQHSQSPLHSHHQQQHQQQQRIQQQRQLEQQLQRAGMVNGGGMINGEESLGVVRGLIGNYSLKRCQGFVRCDMDVDAEVVGWVIGKNGSTIKDMKHKTGCNMWVDQRALKLTITGPDVRTVENAAKSVEAYMSAAPIKAGAVEAAVTRTLDCPPHLLDVLGDRAAIARVVKETRAQVVVNKKMMRVIVRGNPHAVELACGKVQRSIHAAMAQHARQQLEEQQGMGGMGMGGQMGGGYNYTMSPPMAPLSNAMGDMGMQGGLHQHGQPPRLDRSTFHSNMERYCNAVSDRYRFRSSSYDGTHSEGADSDTDTDSIAFGSIGSGPPGGMTSSSHSPVSSTPHSPSTAAAIKLRAAEAAGGELDGGGPGTWSLFSSPFNGGVTTTQDDKTTTCSPCSTPATSVPATPVPSPQLTASAPFHGAPLPPAMYLETVSEEAHARNAREQSMDAGSNASGGSLHGSAAGRVGSPLGCDASLADMLQGLALDKYGGVFEENEIDIDALSLMEEDDLKELSIPKGPRLKILNAVRNHQQRRAA